MLSTQVQMLIVFTAVVALLSPHYVEPQPTRPKKLCSTQLTDALILICQGRGFRGPQSESSSNEDGYISRDQATSLLNNRGVANHCCNQGCTKRDLESYCARPRNDGEDERSVPAFDDVPEETEDNQNNHTNNIQSENMITVVDDDDDDDHIEVGTIPPEFLGTPVILSRGRVYRSPLNF